MFETLNLKAQMSKKEYKAQMEALEPELARLQRECRAADIPVVILFEGLDGAGKGRLINRLISSLDPRGFQVYTKEKPSEEEKRHPYLWRYFTCLPAAGNIAIFDRGWYTRLQLEQFHGKLTEQQTGQALFAVNSLEQLLYDDGYVLIKFFLVISKEEQKRRFQALENAEESSWRVTGKDWKRHKKYKKFLRISEEMLEHTNVPYAPWHIVEATDDAYASARIIRQVAASMEEALTRKNETGKGRPGRPKSDVPLKRVRSMPLKQADLSLCLAPDVYKEQLAFLQQRLSTLHNQLYQKQIPVVLVFEGWDAGGKGGAIRRLTQALDPRGYQVHPVSAPTAEEKRFHYLYRFWKNMPKDGHIAIFDRSWYGRVMVERIEGFCKTDEWKRAYQEINNMEQILADHGCVIVKFWMHIDRDEQEKRFLERQQNPEKQWKITEEDWRNRSKWEQYEVAVNEMIVRTSTAHAPWVIVEGNSKPYARIKVLRTVIEAIEAAVDDR